MNKYFPFFVTAVVVGGLAFYGGTLFANNSGGRLNPAGNFSGNGQNFANLSPEERQARFQQMGGSMGGTGRRMGQGGMINGNAAIGEIMSNDDKSLTVKLRDGGSKIIFFSDSTKIMKTTDATSSDLIKGKSVTVTGIANDDGSLTAQSIQLRPNIDSVSKQLP